MVIAVEKGEFWIHFFNRDSKNYKQYKRELFKKNHGTLGKYLLFSDNKHDLIKLALDFLFDEGLYHSKISTKKNETMKKGFEHVLCLYDYRRRKTIEKRLEKTIKGKPVTYLVWKLDKETMRGEYPELKDIQKS